jgi:23S rRNA (uracil1939-C5)-methyltransferase
VEASQTAARPPRPDLGAEVEVTIDALAYGGNGVARLDGYVLFVSGAVPGDRVRARVSKRKRHYGEARALEVLQPGPDRIAPVADHPGAPWQVLPYERQLQIKAEQVDDALRRIGHLDGFELEDIVPAEQQWRYRNKAEFSFGNDEAGTLHLGFHPPGRWDLVAPMEECLLISERADAARRAVLEWARGQGLSAIDRRDNRPQPNLLLRNLVVREGRRTGQLQVRLVTGPAPDDALDVESLTAAVDAEGLFWTRTDQLAETTAGGETSLIAGVATLEEELCGLNFAISPEAFFQTNTEMAERLYGVAREYAALTGFERVYDLFCGIGTIGLSLAPRAGEVWGVEIIPEAVADAINSARANDVRNARFFAGDVRTSMRDLVEQAGRPDVVVVDPPRAGLSQKIVRRIIESGPKRVVYVSCNPTTLAPNAAQLAEAGYALKRVRPVDMFPQTPHIECVAVLDRAG